MSDQFKWASVAALGMLAAAGSASGDEIGPGFAISDYSVTATASPGSDSVENTNTYPAGTVTATDSTGGVVGSEAIASATEAANYYQGQVYTSINGGLGSTSADGSTLIDFRLSGAPAGSVTQIELTFDESATLVAATPVPGSGPIASFSLDSTFELDGQNSAAARVNAAGLYESTVWSSSGSTGMVGIVDPAKSDQFDLSGSSTLTVDATNNLAFLMDNSLSAQVFEAVALGTYDVDISAVAISNSAGVLPTITPIQPTPVPLPPSVIAFLSGLFLIGVRRTRCSWIG